MTHEDALFLAFTTLMSATGPGRADHYADLLSQEITPILAKKEVDGNFIEFILKSGRIEWLDFFDGQDDRLASLYIPEDTTSIRALHHLSEDFLLAAHARFKDLIFARHQLAKTAARRGFVRLAQDLGHEALLPNQNADMALVEILSECAPDSAPYVQDLLLANLDQIADVAQSCIYDADNLKAIAVLMRAGIFVTDPNAYMWTNESQNLINPLFEKAKTGHGRLALMSQEADVVDLLARDQNAPFYGLRYDVESHILCNA